jgi:hypothetical protein
MSGYKKEYISNSAANMAKQCGIGYDKSYNKGVWPPPGSALIFGRALHHGAEVNFKQKIESRVDLPVEEVVDACIEYWEGFKHEVAWNQDELDSIQIADVEGLDPKELHALKVEKLEEEKVADIKKLMTEFMTESAPKIQPISVEEKLYSTFDEHYPDLMGIIDILEEVKNEEGYADGVGQVDLKFPGKSPNSDDILTDNQPSMYQALCDGNNIKLVRLRKIYTVNNKKAKTVDQMSTPRTDEEMERFYNRMRATVDYISEGKFLPPENGSWKCTPKWCGHYETCQFRT